MDKDGKPVAGLKASDFVVTLDGQARAVQTVDYVEFRSEAAAAADPARAAPAAPATTGPRPTTERRVAAFPFDDQSITPLTGRSLTVAANRTLDQFLGPTIPRRDVDYGMLPTVNPGQRTGRQ